MQKSIDYGESSFGKAVELWRNQSSFFVNSTADETSFSEEITWKVFWENDLSSEFNPLEKPENSSIFKNSESTEVAQSEPDTAESSMADTPSRQEVDAKIAASSSSLKADFATLGADMRSEMSTMRGDIKAAVEALRGDMHKTASENLRWIVGTALTLAALTVTILTFVINNAAKTPQAQPPQAQSQQPVIVNVMPSAAPTAGSPPK